MNGLYEYIPNLGNKKMSAWNATNVFQNIIN